ncbi:ExbD/TolR family protein [Aerosakkonema funiforme]|uniref:Biopolymer transporter ExbD n=2 Tax=Oscillatoriophycideae TaxID=1301283 RepID=A0A926VKJ9_9CYAN|nr:biopolymer transporter ExbD [Aerosakkonema funiforme]MBD2185520.1 biopolymer transporter ExbD [Aerosakkonema funiforme FACHB-1375]
MKINLDSPSDDIKIELIPLIDVIFCILTFFILAALQFTRQQAINVDLPKASSSTTPAQTRQLLIVSINPFNQIYVENELVTPENLEQKLREYRQTNPEGTMVLYASKTAFYNDVVQVLDKMRLFGGDRVALATLPDTPNRAIDSPVPSPTPGLTPYSPGLTPPATNTPGLTPNTGTGTNTLPYNPYNPYATPNPAQPPGTLTPSPSVPGSGVLTPTVPPSGVVPQAPGTVPTPGTSTE